MSFCGLAWEYYGPSLFRKGGQATFNLSCFRIQSKINDHQFYDPRHRYNTYRAGTGGKIHYEKYILSTMSTNIKTIEKCEDKRQWFGETFFGQLKSNNAGYGERMEEKNECFLLTGIISDASSGMIWQPALCVPNEQHIQVSNFPPLSTKFLTLWVMILLLIWKKKEKIELYQFAD